MKKNPHFKEWTEVKRLFNGLDLDAVLAKGSGSNLELFIVKTGTTLHGAQLRAALVHVESIHLEWLTPDVLEIRGNYSNCVVHDERSIIHSEPGALQINVREESQVKRWLRRFTKRATHTSKV